MLHNEGDFQRSSPNIGRELPFCTICKVAEWSAADTCRISQPVQCSRERPPSFPKWGNLKDPKTLNSDKCPRRWRRLRRDRWRTYSVRWQAVEGQMIREHRRPSYLMWSRVWSWKSFCVFCGVSERKKWHLSPLSVGIKNTFEKVSRQNKAATTQQNSFFFAKVFLLFSVLTSDVERLHVSPQTVCSQRDTWTFWQVRSFFFKKKKKISHSKMPSLAPVWAL